MSHMKIYNSEADSWNLVNLEGLLGSFPKPDSSTANTHPVSPRL